MTERTAQRMCVWRSAADVCDKNCKWRYVDKYSCDGDGECMWDASISGGGQCKGSCGMIFDQSKCDADVMCQWDTNVNKCLRRCDS